MSQVEQLLRARYISVNDFSDGNDKFKFTDGTKVTSRNFKVKKMKIGDVEFEKVRCKMVDNGQPARLGSGIFNDYFGVEAKDGKLWLKKIDDGN